MKEMKLWKFLFLLIFGSFIFLFAYIFVQTPIALGLSSYITIPLSLVGVLILLSFYYGWTRFFEQRNVSELNLKRMLPDVGIGFGIGFVFFLAIVAVMMILGIYRIDSFGFELLPTVHFLVTNLIVAVGEEIVFRGFIHRMILERWGLLAALIVSSLVFGFMHYPNPEATVWSSVAIALEAGVMLGLAYCVRNNLWLPIGIHWAWNFSQGQIWGIAVSGMEVNGSWVRPVIEGPEILTGGSFGAEASIIAVIISVGISYYFYKKMQTR